MSSACVHPQCKSKEVKQKWKEGNEANCTREDPLNKAVAAG